MWSHAVFKLAAFVLTSKFLHHTTSSQAASFPPLGPSTPIPCQDHKAILQNLARLMYVSPINHLPLVLISLAQKGMTVSPIEVWASEQWALGVVAVAYSAHNQVHDGHSHDQQHQLTAMTNQQ